MDRFTVRNLELISPNATEAITLLEVVDHTVTAMGGRLLRQVYTVELAFEKYHLGSILNANSIFS